MRFVIICIAVLSSMFNRSKNINEITNMKLWYNEGNAVVLIIKIFRGDSSPQITVYNLPKLTPLQSTFDLINNKSNRFLIIQQCVIYTLYIQTNCKYIIIDYINKYILLYNIKVLGVNLKRTLLYHTHSLTLSFLYSMYMKYSAVII